MILPSAVLVLKSWSSIKIIKNGKDAIKIAWDS